MHEYNVGQPRGQPTNFGDEAVLTIKVFRSNIPGWYLALSPQFPKLGFSAPNPQDAVEMFLRESYRQTVARGKRS